VRDKGLESIPESRGGKALDGTVGAPETFRLGDFETMRRWDYEAKAEAEGVSGVGGESLPFQSRRLVGACVPDMNMNLSDETN